MNRRCFARQYLPPLPLLEDPPLRGEAVPLLLEPPRDRCSLARVGGDGYAQGVAAFDGSR